jgi:hypothetical protein
MLEAQFFLLPQRVLNKEYGDSGNHGNQSVTFTLYETLLINWLCNYTLIKKNSCGNS